MDITDLVLRDGDQVRAYGRIVVDGGVIWFEPPLPVLLVYPPGPPRPSGLGVPTAGVDLDALDDGWAALTGRWQGDRLVVTEQETRRPVQERTWRWDRPPCPAPAGGWPEGAVNENIEVPPDLLSSIPVTAVAMFRPSPRQAVLVVATEEPDQVDATLRPRYGDRLCVVRSRWARGQIDELLGQLRAGMAQWLIYTCGETVSEHGQALVTADVTRVLPAFAEWGRTVPDGLLTASPWLAPRPRLGIANGCGT